MKNPTYNLSTAAGLEKLQAALDDLQRRCSARTTSAAEIAEMLDHVRAAIGVSKKALAGTAVTLDPNAQHFPSAYKYRPESTVVHAVFRAGHWTVTDISRDTCRAPSLAAVVNLSDAARAELIPAHSAFSIYDL